MGRILAVVSTLGFLFLAVSAAPTETDEPPVLLSRQLMERQGLAVGDLVRLSSSRDGRLARSFRVSGQYEPVPDPYRLGRRQLTARLHLPDLIALRADPLDPRASESVTRINVALRDPIDADAFAEDLSARMPGLTVWSTAGREEEGDPFLVLERFHTAIAAVTVIGSAAFLLALMVIRSEERRETAGILRLIGFSRARILVEVFVEAVLIAVAGALVGILLALGLEGLFNRFFQWYYDTALVFVQISPGIAVRCVVISVPLGVVAGIVASWSLLRRNIMTLLRR